jgi:hypothetical protein
MLPALRSTLVKRFDALIDLAGIGLSLSGATAAVVFGKVLLAVILGSVTLGIFLRFAGRRAKRLSPAATTPGWIRPTSAILAIVEGTALVEAVDLPVRFSQPGFQAYHWAYVVVFLVVAYWLQVRLFTAVSRKRRAPSAPVT